MRDLGNGAKACTTPHRILLGRLTQQIAKSSAVLWEMQQADVRRACVIDWSTKRNGIRWDSDGPGTSILINYRVY